MSLADELLRDLEDLSEGEGEYNEDEEIEHANEPHDASANGKDDGNGDIEMKGDLDADNENDNDNSHFAQESEETRKEEANRRDGILAEIKQADKVDKVASLTRSRRYREVLNRMAELAKYTSAETDDATAYELAIKANDLVHEIDAEQNIVHKYIRDHYNPRFPELEGLIMNPMEYTKVVKILGNDIGNAQAASAELKRFVPPARIMIINVTVATSPGRPLTGAELSAVNAACDMMMTLSKNRDELVGFIEARMGLIAPNVTALVGSYVAAKLVGLAGGIIALAKMPSCNLLSLGATRKSLAGFSIANVNVRDGVIGRSDFIQNTPPEFYKRAMRAISAKTILAARVDSIRSHPDGSTGENFKKVLDDKLQFWLKPPPNRHVKPMAIPFEGRKTKRGGRKVRKFKEKFKMTELRKQQNKMAFGTMEDEVIVGDEAVGLGMIGAENLGKVRAATVDPRGKWKPKQAKGVKFAAGAAGTTSTHNAFKNGNSGNEAANNMLGSATPYAFTPMQGIELIDPEAKRRKLDAINEKYFGAMTPFPK